MLSREEVKKSGDLSIRYTSFESVRKGFAERYIEAFATFLGATSFQFTLLVSVPQFLGGIVQLFTLNFLSIFKSRKRMSIVLCILQGLIWLPIMFLAFMDSPSVMWIYIALVSVYFILTLVHNPIWNSWIMDIIPMETRGRYLSLRSKIIDAMTMISFVAGGFILNRASHIATSTAWTYASLFIVAIISNVLAVRYLKNIYEPEYAILKPRISLKKFSQSLKTRSQGRIVLYLSLMSFSVYVSAAFFTPYVLRTLEFSYIFFVLLFIFPFISRLLFANRIGRAIDKYGPKKVLRFVSFGMAFNPLLWLVHDSFLWLIFAQLYAGLFYSAYEISSMAFFINETDSKNRLSLFSYYNFFNGMFILLGALSSNILIKIGPYGNPYLNAFLFSGILRLLVLFIRFPKAVKEKDYYVPTSYKRMSTDMLALNYPRELFSKMAVVKDMLTIRAIHKGDIATTLHNGKMVRVKKSEVIHYKPKKVKKIIKEPQKLPSHIVYACNDCNAEFRRNVKSKTTLKCPYCGNDGVYFMRRDEGKKKRR